MAAGGESNGAPGGRRFVNQHLASRGSPVRDGFHRYRPALQARLPRCRARRWPADEESTPLSGRTAESGAASAESWDDDGASTDALIEHGRIQAGRLRRRARRLHREEVVTRSGTSDRQELRPWPTLRHDCPTPTGEPPASDCRALAGGRWRGPATDGSRRGRLARCARLGTNADPAHVRRRERLTFQLGDHFVAGLEPILGILHDHPADDLEETPLVPP